MVEKAHDQHACHGGDGNGVFGFEGAANCDGNQKQKDDKSYDAKLDGDLQKDVVGVHDTRGTTDSIMRIDDTPRPLPYTNADGVVFQHAKSPLPCLQAITNGALSKVADAEKSFPNAHGQDGESQNGKRRQPKGGNAAFAVAKKQKKQALQKEAQPRAARPRQKDAERTQNRRGGKKEAGSPFVLRCKGRPKRERKIQEQIDRQNVGIGEKRGNTPTNVTKAHGVYPPQFCHAKQILPHPDCRDCDKNERREKNEGIRSPFQKEATCREPYRGQKYRHQCICGSAVSRKSCGKLQKQDQKDEKIGKVELDLAPPEQGTPRPQKKKHAEWQQPERGVLKDLKKRKRRKQNEKG